MSTSSEYVGRDDGSRGRGLNEETAPKEWRGLEMGPRNYLHAERSRLQSLSWKHFDAVPLGSTVGAELRGVDVSRELPDEVFAEVRQALLDYKVIFLRDQVVDAAAQVAFARRFGDLELHPFIPPNGDHPELCRFEKSADIGGYENLWHHDVTWREKPSKVAILHAVSVPASGGDTLFSDMHAAYDGLSDDWKARIEDMVVVHDYMRAFGAGVPEEKRAEIRAKFPQPEHPAAGVHAETGKRYLYVNRVFVDHIKGSTREESLPIIEHLARQAEYPEHQCRFHWTKGAIAIWDNRAVQHYAASDYWPDVRIMERASVIGERPTA